MNMMIYVKISNFKWIKCCFFMGVLVPYTVATTKQKNLVTIDAGIKGFSFVEDADTPEIESKFLNDPRMNKYVALVAHTGREPAGGQFFRGGEIITIGIVIDRNHILSSYTPFRTMRKEIPLSKLKVYHYEGTWDYNNVFAGYLLESKECNCARQVMPMHEDDLTAEQWHGSDHMHTPVHDLMVFKLKVNITDEPQYELQNYTKHGVTLHFKVPIVSELATPTHFLSDQLVYITLAFIEKGGGRVRDYLREVDLYGHGRVVLDCDEWFIREWGHFICVKGIEEDQERLGSGAILISERRVFGVGSFYLKKGKDSIVVFTDVRPYHHLIMKTCSKLDGFP